MKEEKIKVLDEPENQLNNIVNVNDIVTLSFIFGEDDIETDLYKLVEDNLVNKDNQYITITMNSPLGKAINHNEVGSVVSYTVENETFKVKIEEKIKLLSSKSK